jgi:hypothetical protein
MPLSAFCIPPPLLASVGYCGHGGMSVSYIFYGVVGKKVLASYITLLNLRTLAITLVDNTLPYGECTDLQ